MKGLVMAHDYLLENILLNWGLSIRLDLCKMVLLNGQIAKLCNIDAIVLIFAML